MSIIILNLIKAINSRNFCAKARYMLQYIDRFWRTEDEEVPAASLKLFDILSHSRLYGAM